MSATHFIRCTIAVRVIGSKSTLLITPCSGFLTPDKESAIGFPVPGEGNAVDAKIINLSNENRFECDAKAVKSYVPSLIEIAAQQKPIELYLDFSSGIDITGFLFPAPIDHAQGR